MCRTLVLFALPWLFLGCAEVSEGRKQAARCAESWKAKGFEFDPTTMTCEQMFERAQATWKAEYWRKQGYVFDPATMTAQEMDRRARELQEAARSQTGNRNATKPPTAQALVGLEVSENQAGMPEIPQAQANPNPAGTGTARPAAAPSQGKRADASSGGGSSDGAVAVPDDPEVDPDLRRMLKKMTVLDVRLQYPQYNDLKDGELARRIHEKYFPDTPFEDFARRFLRYTR